MNITEGESVFPDDKTFRELVDFVIKELNIQVPVILTIKRIKTVLKQLQYTNMKMEIMQI